MTIFSKLDLKIKKSVAAGSSESLLSLFDAQERFKKSVIQCAACEGALINLQIGDLGELNLKIGADMTEGSRKNIMTLFWYEEKVKTFELKNNLDRGKVVTLVFKLI